MEATKVTMIIDDDSYGTFLHLYNSRYSLDVEKPYYANGVITAYFLQSSGSSLLSIFELVKGCFEKESELEEVLIRFGYPIEVGELRGIVVLLNNKEAIMVAK